MSRPHMWDTAIEEVVKWHYAMSERVADAVKAGGRAPFAADITETDKLKFYERKFFTPTGAENKTGREQVMARLGPEGYAEVYKALVKPQDEQSFPTIDGMYRTDDGDLEVD